MEGVWRVRVRGSAKNLGPLFEGRNKVLLLGKVPLAPAGIFSGRGGGREVRQGRACKGGRRVGVPGAEPGEFSKNL